MKKFMGLLLAFVSINAFAENKVADVLLSEIETSAEPGKILSRTWEDNSEWKILMDGIRTGEIRWIKAYEKLRAVSDAGASEELDLSLVYSLEKNPEVALRAMGVTSFATTNCDSTDEAMDDDAKSSEVIKKILGHIELRIKKIEAITNKILIPAKNPCLNVLKLAQTHWNKKIKKSETKRVQTKPIKR